MGKTYRHSYDISLHAVERYVERVKGERVSGMLPQWRIDGVRREMQQDLAGARELSPAAGLALTVRGRIAPNHTALAKDTRIYVLKGRKVLTMFDADPDTLALADELSEQSEQGSGVFGPSGGYDPDTLACPPQHDAARGLGSLTIPRSFLEVLAGEWGCLPEHNEFGPRLARLRRRAQAVNPGLFRKDTDVEPDAAWCCYRYDYFRFAVANGTMAVCVVV